METNKQDLIPCPFCKGKMTRGLGAKTGCQMHGDPIQHVLLKCRNQSCPVKPEMRGDDRYRGSEEPKYDKQVRDELDDRWNALLCTQPAIPSEVIEMVVEALDSCCEDYGWDEHEKFYDVEKVNEALAALAPYREGR